MNLILKAAKILKPEPNPTPWIWMMVTGLSTFAPLALGYYRGEIGIAIYGGLTGYLLGLIDQPGPWRRRVFLSVLSLFGSLIGFLLGISTHDAPTLFVCLSFVLVYALALMGGMGAEYERTLLFVMVQLFVARFSSAISWQNIFSVFLYFLTAFAAMNLAIAGTGLKKWENGENLLRLKEAVSLFFTKKLNRHVYALHFSLAIIAGIYLVDKFEVSRGYWTVITVLLVMKPNRRETIYRLFQRLVGTLTGVFVAELLIKTQLPLLALIFSASLFAALVPYCWKKNYWLVTFFATNFVIVLLSMAQFGHIDGKLTFVRLIASLYGCGIGLVAIFVFHLSEKLMPKSRS